MRGDRGWNPRVHWHGVERRWSAVRKFGPDPGIPLRLPDERFRREEKNRTSKSFYKGRRTVNTLTRGQRLQPWYRHARIGLFVHWGMLTGEHVADPIGPDLRYPYDPRSRARPSKRSGVPSVGLPPPSLSELNIS